MSTKQITIVGIPQTDADQLWLNIGQVLLQCCYRIILKTQIHHLNFHILLATCLSKVLQAQRRDGRLGHIRIDKCNLSYLSQLSFCTSPAAVLEVGLVT